MNGTDVEIVGLFFQVEEGIGRRIWSRWIRNGEKRQTLTHSTLRENSNRAMPLDRVAKAIINSPKNTANVE